MKKQLEETQEFLLSAWYRLDLIDEYVQWHINTLTDDIEDYIDDDKIGNKDIIGELKEEREHWNDVKKLLNGETDNLYIKDAIMGLDD